MTQPTPRKSPTKASKTQDRRPRIDTIIRAIKEGKFDDDLGLLSGAIKDRNSKRQEKVLALVHETFGEDYEVVSKKEKSKEIFKGVSQVISGADDIPEGWHEIKSSPEPDFSPDSEEGIESRSPIIGSMSAESG